MFFTLAATEESLCSGYLHLVLLAPLFKGHVPQHLEISVAVSVH